MSLVRFSQDSDVYVFWGYYGIECCGCSLYPHGIGFETDDEMIVHLLEHREAGHKVPDHALAVLWELDGDEADEEAKIQEAWNEFAHDEGDS